MCVYARCFVLCYYFMAQQPLEGQALLTIEASRSHTPHSVVVPWTSDRPVLTTHDTHTRQTSMPPGMNRTRIPSKRADPGPRGRWDWRSVIQRIV